MAANIHEMTAVRPVLPGVYESLCNPMRMGNANNIAYGGCTLGIAASTAHQDLPEGYFLYSMAGNYLGPALTDRKYICSAEEVRKTRTFITKLVRIQQKLDDGQSRMCLIALADFQRREPASLLMYSRPPSMVYAGVDDQPSYEASVKNLLQSGAISQEMLDRNHRTFGMMRAFFEIRPCQEGTGAQRLIGQAKHIRSTQDHLPLTSRTSADWLRCPQAQGVPATAASALAFILDGSLSFAPLTLSGGMFLEDVGACSTLDFAMRIFTNDLRIEEWHLREIKTMAGGAGRSYSEAQVWDSTGNMIASMTQASILRPKAPAKAKI